MKFFIIFASFIALVASDKLVIKDPTIINDDTLVKTDVIKFPIEIVTIKPKLPKIVSSDDEENEGLIRRYMGYLNDVNKNVKFFMKTKNVNPARVAEFYGKLKSIIEYEKLAIDLVDLKKKFDAGNYKDVLRVVNQHLFEKFFELGGDMSELNQEKSHDEKVDEIIESESEEIERIRIEKRKKEIYLIIQEYIEFIKDILKKEKTQEVRDKLNEDLEGFEKSRESTIKELISFSDDEINKIKKIVEESKVLLIKEIEEIKDKKIKGILQKIVDYMNFDLTIYPKDSHIHNVLRRMYMDKTFEKIKGYIINDDIEKAFKIFNKYISKRIEEYKIENNIFDTLNRRIEIYLRDPKFKQTNENFFNPEISGKNPVTGEYQIKPFRLPQWNGVDFRSTKIVIPQWNGVDFRTKTINLPQWNGVDFISKTENIPQWNGVDSMKKTGNIPQWNGVDFIKKIINIPQWNGVDFMKKTGNIPQWNGEFFVSQESNLPQWNGVDSKSDVKSKSLLNRQIRTKALNLSQ